MRDITETLAIFFLMILGMGLVAALAMGPAIAIAYLLIKLL